MAPLTATMSTSFNFVALIILGTLVLTVTAVPGGELFQRQACNANNCLRAVRAATSSGSVECSSFFRTTLVGCGGSTVTLTSSAVTTATEYDVTTTFLTYVPTGPGGPQKRQASICSTRTITPSSIPGYASRCSSAAAYSSACSCQAVSRSTITSNVGNVVTTTLVQTSTQTTTAFTTVTRTPSSNYFYIVLPGGRRVIGRYESPDTVLTASSVENQYAVFFLNQASELQFYPSDKINYPKVGVRSVTGKDKLIALGTNDAGTRLVCTLSNPGGGGGALVCTAGGDERFPVLCDNDLYYSVTRDQAGCSAVDLFAVRAG